SVQALLSLQSSAGPGSHRPVAGLHCSMPSHTVPFPAAQAAATGVGVPTHAPDVQTSFSLQSEASSQGLVLNPCVQPDAGSQLSSVHGLLSSQTGGVPT